VKALNGMTSAIIMLVGFLFVIITLEGSTRDTAILLTIIAMVAHITSLFTEDKE